MKDKNKEFFSEMLFGLTAAGKVFLPALAAAACLSVNVYYALASAIVCLALSVTLEKKVLSVNAFLLVPVIFVAAAAGNGALPLAVFAASGLCVLLSLSKNQLTFPPYVKAGAAMGLAFSITVLLTTYYFGIGASGSTTFEMLKNYRYLGFHPNWRGVFFGTVTLFTMIVFPYRFKKLSKYLPAEFVSLIIPLVLNLFLNPDKNSSPVLEVGALSDMTALSGVKSFLPLFDFSAFSGGEGLVTVAKGAFALAFVWALFKPQERKASLAAASCGAVSALLGGFPAARRNILKYTSVSALTAVAVSTLFAVLCPGIISRIPLHSLAVMFIVSVWQRVPFRLAAPVFAERNFVGLVLFFVSAFVFVFFNPFIAAIICVVFSAAAGRIKK